MTANNDYNDNQNLIVWLDEIGGSRISNIQIKLFSNRNECIDYITDLNDEKVRLIISSDDKQDFLFVIQTLTQIRGIYIFNSKEKTIKNTFSSVDELSAKLTYDIRESDEKILFDTFTNSTNENSATFLRLHNIKFMYFHILIDILLKMEEYDNVTSRQDMITYLRKTFNETESNRKLIDEFARDYSRINSIEWYTKGTFLYSLLNKALRESDFDTLFALRCFIVDLYQELGLEHQQFLDNNPDDYFLKVYRGQAISQEELNRLREKQNGYFSMQSFLSTSADLAVAHAFSGGGIAHSDPNQTWILYEFRIDTHLNNTKPYASINHRSQFQNENEILIGLGAIFRIDSVQFDDANQCWHAKLSLCNDENFDLHRIMREYAAEIVLDKISPGFLLYQQGNYAKAREYFQTLLKNRSLNVQEKAHCYRGLGAVAAEENNYDEAYKIFMQEFNIWHELDDEPNIMGACKNIGDVLFHLKRFEESLEYLQTAGLYFRLNDYPMEYARIYGMIGNIMTVSEQWDNCLMCYEFQLEARQRLLDPNHEDIGISHANIATIYAAMKKYEEAVDHFTQALNIYQHSYQPDHPNVIIAKQNLENAVCLLRGPPT